jgi:ABC-type branched-subunit amino acid transport system ATPase component/ABC-type branched-subunit amino acid transport system permease subunit
MTSVRWPAVGRIAWPKMTGRLARTGLIALALLIWPFIGAPFSILGDAIQACIILVVTVSLVLLIGWVGQISLAHAAFVGVGAFSTGLFARGLHVGFPLSLVLAAAVSAAVASALGIVALRVRGLYLAVATLIFAWIADQYLFRSSWLVGVGGSSAIPGSKIGRPNAVPFFDLAERRSLYFVVLAVAAIAVYVAANVRDSKTGRAFFAVRGSEMAAASLGIDVRRYKLLAFALSGCLAGAAGNLLIISQGSAVPAQFSFTVSLFYLAVVVVGGLTSLGGAIAASILFAGLSELFVRVSALAGWLEVVSAALLALVLLAYPGGLAAVPKSLERPRKQLEARFRTFFAPQLEEISEMWARVRDRLPAWARAEPDERHVSEAEVKRSEDSVIVAAQPRSEGHMPLVDTPGRARLVATRALPPPAERGRQGGAPAVLEAKGVIVRFGGLTAVNGVSLAVHQGEIVGLIGPNGAGKTTTFNAISGLNVPTEGTIRLNGTDVTNEPVHRRAAMGLARTFQAIQLFSQLNVFDNLLVATHLQNHTGVFSHIVVSAPSLEAEDRSREVVRRAIALLGLEDVADRLVSGLPFGVLRLVEIARAVVTGAPVVMLDEPASGLDNAETDRLAELLFFVRAELGLSMLLIEHDIRMVTSVSDYMYVIDRGTPLADGVPSDVQRNEAVIAAYLGDAAMAST